MNAAVKQLESLVKLISNYELDTLSVSQLSHDMGLSRWQLQRMFLALTQMTLNQYLRAFRLSRAAEMLVKTDMGILDIAVASGFSSQEAFTRSFKERFKVTPRTYRLNGYLDHISFELFIPKTRQWSKAMNIEIKTKPALKLTGHLAYFNCHGMKDANNFQVIPTLWEGINQEAKAQQHNVKTWYGYIYDSDKPAEGSHRYLASYDESEGQLEISNAVKEMVAGQQYAILPHHGELSKLGDTLDAFYGEWLPNSGYKMVQEFNIEVYDHRFDPLSSESYFETWIPVQPI